MSGSLTVKFVITGLSLICVGEESTCPGAGTDSKAKIYLVNAEMDTLKTCGRSLPPIHRARMVFYTDEVDIKDASWVSDYSIGPDGREFGTINMKGRKICLESGPRGAGPVEHPGRGSDVTVPSSPNSEKGFGWLARVAEVEIDAAGRLSKDRIGKQKYVSSIVHFNEGTLSTSDFAKAPDAFFKISDIRDTTNNRLYRAMSEQIVPVTTCSTSQGRVWHPSRSPTLLMQNDPNQRNTCLIFCGTTDSTSPRLSPIVTFHTNLLH